MPEADAHDINPLLSNVLENARTLRTPGPPGNRTLADLVGTTPGRLTRLGEQRVRSMGNFERRRDRAVEQLSHSRVLRERQLENQERRLERRLEGRSEHEIDSTADAQERELASLEPSDEDVQSLERLSREFREAQQERQRAVAAGDWHAARRAAERRDEKRSRLRQLQRRFARVEAERARRLRRMPELRLRRTREDLAELRAEAPDQASLERRAAQGIYQDWAERWQRILHGLGDTSMPE